MSRVTRVRETGLVFPTGEIQVDDNRRQLAKVGQPVGRGENEKQRKYSLRFLFGCWSTPAKGVHYERNDWNKRNGDDSCLNEYVEQLARLMNLISIVNALQRGRLRL